ncbi:MAG: hypothetical protein JSU69_04295 [Candidatus Zixiibacteriota bacterium]|nr:MAG: hypothetical protein JSU69_04295 [candidate division Zixibacteria bacterium]
MKRIIILTLSICIITALGSGSKAGYLFEVEEILAGNHAGFGARQMAMGGAGIMGMDGTALFYNPANLARIPRIEFNLGLSYQKFKDESFTRVLGPGTVLDDGDQKTNTRLNTAILSIPYPTYRGSLVFGVGMVRQADFDKVSTLLYEEDDAGTLISNPQRTFESGGLNQWGFGMGIDLSPRLSFGVTALLYRGKHEFNLQSDIYESGQLVDPWSQLLEYRYMGIGGKLGLAMQLSRYVGLGLTAELPVNLHVDWEETFITDGVMYESDEYDLKKPFVFSAGVLARFNNVSLLADADYADWTQLQYGDNVIMELDNELFKEYYREVLGYRIGGEYVLPTVGLSLRAGYFHDPLPYKKEFFDKDRRGYSFGFGILVDQVMTIDFAYVRGNYKTFNELDSQDFTYKIALNNDVAYSRAFVTGAYRF